MDKSQNAVIVPFSVKKSFKHENTTMVEADISVPQIETGVPPRVRRRINSFYSFLSEQKLKQAQSRLLKQAKRQWEKARASALPFTPYALKLTYTVCINQDGILSLYYDIEETTLGESVTLRYADTWNLTDGYPLDAPKWSKKEVVKVFEKQIRDPNGYYGNLPQNLKKYFNRQQSYRQPEGMAVFYQQCTIAPKSAGIPVFFAGA